MRTYCIVQADGQSYTLSAVSVFEVDSEFPLMEAALRYALLEKRPVTILSYRIESGGGAFRVPSTTRFEDRLPIKVAGITFEKVN